MPTSTIPASRARKELFEIIERVQKPATPYVRLTVNGEGRAIIMSESEWESWQETVAIMSDPKAMEGIRRAEQQIERGEYRSAEEVFRRLEPAMSIAEDRPKYGTRRPTKRRAASTPRKAKRS
jgi:antitoxin YefM